MIWLIGFGLGVALPWAIRPRELLGSFSRSVVLGAKLWGLISMITIPFSMIMVLVLQELT